MLDMKRLRKIGQISVIHFCCVVTEMLCIFSNKSEQNLSAVTREASPQTSLGNLILKNNFPRWSGVSLVHLRLCVFHSNIVST